MKTTALAAAALLAGSVALAGCSKSNSPVITQDVLGVGGTKAPAGATFTSADLKRAVPTVDELSPGSVDATAKMEAVPMYKADLAAANCTEFAEHFAHEWDPNTTGHAQVAYGTSDDDWANLVTLEAYPDVAAAQRSIEETRIVTGRCPQVSYTSPDGSDSYRVAHRTSPSPSPPTVLEGESTYHNADGSVSSYGYRHRIVGNVIIGASIPTDKTGFSDANRRELDRLLDITERKLKGTLGVA